MGIDCRLAGISARWRRTVRAERPEYLSGVEREAIAALAVPASCSRECWRFPDRRRAPLIERL